MALSPFRRQKPAMYDYTSSLDQRNEDLLERERRRISYEKYLEFLRLGQSGHDNIQRARQEMESQGLFKSPEERHTLRLPEFLLVMGGLFVPPMRTQKKKSS